MIRRLALWGALCLLGASWRAEAQSFALSTNIPSLLTGTLNVQPSVALTRHWSLELSLQARPFTYSHPMPTGLIETFYGGGGLAFADRLAWRPMTHTQHALFTPSMRYWKQGVYNRGFFVGGHLIGGVYKWGGYATDPSYARGYLLGAGASVGYNYELSARWNIEAELGLALVHARYDRHSAGGAVEQAQLSRALVLPSRLGISLVYLL